MLKDEQYAFRWQDHVIAADRTRRNLVASTLVAIVLCFAIAFCRGETGNPQSVTVNTTAHLMPSLSQVVKRPVYPRAGQG